MHQPCSIVAGTSRASRSPIRRALTAGVTILTLSATLAGGTAELHRPDLAAYLIATAESPADFDRWYSLDLQSCHAGWMHAVQTTSKTTISSKLTQHLKFLRAGHPVTGESTSEFVETLAGTPVSLTIVESIASAKTTTTYRYSDREISVTVARAGDDPRASTLPPIDGSWLTPAAAAVFVQQRLAAGATVIPVRTVEPDRGPLPNLITRAIGQKTQAEVLGKKIAAYAVSVSIGEGGSVYSELIDERGTVITRDLQVGQLHVQMSLTTRAKAQSSIVAPDLLTSTLVPADKGIKSPREATRATYILHQTPSPSVGSSASPAGKEPGEHSPSVTPSVVGHPTSLNTPSLASRIVATGVQDVHEHDGGAARVIVALSNHTPAPEADFADTQYRRSSTYIDAEDARVRRLATKETPLQRETSAAMAERLRRTVHSYITKKDLAVGFATASEVARTRSGDCTEHAVLLAAMLRSADIPSRVVSGLVYVSSIGREQHVFAYHMWTQALVDDAAGHRWIDLDATLQGNRAFDATHIALVTTPLNEDHPQESLAALLPLLGGLRVEVVETAGK